MSVLSYVFGKKRRIEVFSVAFVRYISEQTLLFARAPRKNFCHTDFENKIMKTGKTNFQNTLKS